MNCPFCAEEIQDAAVLCRFCAAEKTAKDGWVPPARQSPARTRRKGSSIIKSSGGLFLLSGAVSLASVSSDVPLLGAMRSGSTALCYNLLFAMLFLAGTAIYSLDRLSFLLSKNTRDAYLTASGVTQQVKSFVDVSMFDRGIVISSK